MKHWKILNVDFGLRFRSYLTLTFSVVQRRPNPTENLAALSVSYSMLVEGPGMHKRAQDDVRHGKGSSKQDRESKSKITRGCSGWFARRNDLTCAAVTWACGVIAATADRQTPQPVHAELLKSYPSYKNEYWLEYGKATLYNQQVHPPSTKASERRHSSARTRSRPSIFRRVLNCGPSVQSESCGAVLCQVLAVIWRWVIRANQQCWKLYRMSCRVSLGLRRSRWKICPTFPCSARLLQS
ncbi:hypothetical protein RvY_10674 [Ramazzottius varieornatus]|uniref:Uncharacterized protein n=1 Tax=Ramazzottius varieornatus TaxID=947166 RepID=A0A1D1VDK0_RAMVA|nr:hypothetical protein RvY_10674 [Ramazzottius varieornatus]